MLQLSPTLNVNDEFLFIFHLPRYVVISVHHIPTQGTLSTDPFKESILDSEGLRSITTNSILALTDAVQQLPGRQHLVEKLRRYSKLAYEKVILAGQREDAEFNVLCHGDLWSNNAMFRYSEDGQITHTMLVDFQAGYWTSPLLDVVYALYTSSAAEVTEANWDELMAVYQAHLERVLILSNWPKAIPTLAEIQEDRRKRGGYAAGEGLMAMALRNTEIGEGEEFDWFGGEEHNHQYRVRALLNPQIRDNLEFLLEFFDRYGYFDS